MSYTKAEGTRPALHAIGSEGAATAQAGIKQPSLDIVQSMQVLTEKADQMADRVGRIWAAISEASSAAFGERVGEGVVVDHGPSLAGRLDHLSSMIDGLEAAIMGFRA